MSILLEALRKSEKNQRSHETPTIHTDDQSGTVSETLQTAPLALLLAAALLISGWIVWKQYQPPAGSYQPPVTLTAARSHKVTKPVAEDKSVKVESPTPPVATPATQNRTPVETYQAPKIVEEKTTAASIAATNPNSADVAPKETAVPGSAGTTNQPTQTTESKEPVENSQEEFHPGEPEPISYWELPDAVRAEVPEIKFSVLVYAADPADRFVLINGQRLGEGDSAKPGLLVKEIRRDGVVFSYRLYQFLVNR
ncbi:MAG: general secretion pathway protein GspB [Lysobacterales bacterium]